MHLGNFFYQMAFLANFYRVFLLVNIQNVFFLSKICFEEIPLLLDILIVRLICNFSGI